MEQKKTITQLTVAGCFYRYLKLNEFSKVSSVSEIALELGIPEKKLPLGPFRSTIFHQIKTYFFGNLHIFLLRKDLLHLR